MVPSPLTKAFAVLAGILIAGVPTLAFNYWLEAYAARQGQGDVDTTASRTIALAEARIGRAIAVLDELATRGVASCRADHLDAFRKANLSASPIKELSIIGPDGQMLCSDLGLAAGERSIMAAQRAPSRPDILLEVMRIGEKREPFLRIRRPALAGFNGLAALVPADMLLTRVSTNGTTINSHIRMVFRDGNQVAEIGPLPGNGNTLVSSLASNRYGLTATASLPRADTSAEYADLQLLGAYIAGFLSIVSFLFVALLPRRRNDNPVDELRQALQQGQFIPYYQPVVDITNGRLRGAEVLMRWRKPDGTVLSPATFIPLAESSDLIGDMTRQIMEKVRDEMAEAIVDRPFLRFGFNLSARHFEDDSIVADIREIFEGSTLRLTQIVLEVTERQPLDSLTSARQVIAALQGLGVKVAIDDVGAGHSGLSYMLKLGVDIIKIDKMFIDSLGHDANSTTIIETLVDLARNMRMDIVAEGVETFEQVAALRDRGIRAAQGYAFAPPLPGASFLRLLQALDPQRERVQRPAPEQSGIVGMMRGA